MNFFNLFYKNLIGCKIKESDLMHNNKVKVNNFNSLTVSLVPKYSVEKYKIDKLVDKLKTDNRNYIFDDIKTFNDQLQKITDELNELKSINTIKGGGNEFEKKGDSNEFEKKDDINEFEEMYNQIRSKPFDYDDLIYNYKSDEKYYMINESDTDKDNEI